MRAAAALLAILCIAACGSPPDRTPADGAARKLILIIGDGMDDQQITMARNYLVGSDGQLVMDGMPYRGVAQVQTVAEHDPSVPVYVGDSASGATTLATGVVTSIGRVSTAANTDENLVTIMELASAAGLQTGIVSTTRVTDATPAAFVAHIDQRYCQSPRNMVEEDETHPQYSTDCSKDFVAVGGRGSTAEQIVASQVDIVLGGGYEDFAQRVEADDERTLLDTARERGFTILTDKSELASVDTHARVMGLFSPRIMPVRLRGTNGAVAEYVQKTDGKVRWPAPVTCEDEPGFAGMPTLAEMTDAALRFHDDDGGFVLMVESASIDDQAHYWKACGHIGETGQLDEALAVALAYQQEHPETLVIVTADHGHAAHIVPETSELAPQEYASPGRFIRLVTPEGGVMGINYATNDSPDWEEHSGVQVPVYASGPGVDAFPEYMRQADVFTIAARHLGLDPAQAEQH